MKIITIEQIQKVLLLEQHMDNLLNVQRQAFIDFSNGKFLLPMPMQLQFSKNHGDCHIKAGYKEDDESFVIKVATGFYKNWELGLPVGDGAILVFSQKTGLLKAILLDRGFLTIFRTALAACIAASLTPFEINKIGIIGTGNLASWVVRLMRVIYPMVEVTVWGRNIEKSENFVRAIGSDIKISELHELVKNSDLLITTTASHEPIILEKHLHSNIHIISLGADEPEKHEIDPLCFKHANYVIVDYIKQAMNYGDVAASLQQNILEVDHLHELGNLLIDEPLQLKGSNIMLTCLTGIAAQDIAMTKMVLDLLID